MPIQKQRNIEIIILMRLPLYKNANGVCPVLITSRKRKRSELQKRYKSFDNQKLLRIIEEAENYDFTAVKTELQLFEQKM